MSVFTVSTAAQLSSVLGTVKNGDTVLLRAGTYSSVNIQNVNITGNVTIKSADANAPATINNLLVKNSSGLTFSNLELYAKAGSALPFQVVSSARIGLDQIDFHGTLNGSSHDDGRGLVIQRSTDVSVTNSHFREFTDALNHADSVRLLVSGNTFETIRDNGVAGGGTSNLTITNNYFTNFDHIGDVHPDAIQVWTSNTTKSATDILISGNVVVRGTGEPIQGVWINEEVGTLAYDRVTVSNNTIIGAAFNGIGITHVDNLKVTGNTVLGTDDQVSWIMVDKSAGAAITDNLASDYNLANSQAAVQTGNVKLTAANAATLSSLTTWTKTAAVAASAAALSGAVSGQVQATVKMNGFVDAASTTLRATPLVFSEAVVNGTTGADKLKVGDVGDFRLEGGAGNDTLTGGGKGTNKLNGGLGDDTYVIMQKNDIVAEKAGEGTDTVQTYIDYKLTDNVENARAMVADLDLRGNALANSLTGSAGADKLSGEGGDDVIQGGAGNDTIYGGDGADRLLGQDGDDMLFGDAGNDSLYGNAGNDVINGGAGNDSIEGGAGADRLTGGSGADTFVYRPEDFSKDVRGSADTITDFSSKEGDKINLSLIDANGNTAVNDAFKFIGTAGFHGVAGELRYEATKDGSAIYGDTNGDGVADFQINITGLTSLSGTDFYL